MPWTVGFVGGVRRGLLENLDAPFQHLPWSSKRP
jgi:hypothetical protein